MKKLTIITLLISLVLTIGCQCGSSYGGYGYNQQPYDYIQSPTGQQMVVIHDNGTDFLMEYLMFTTLMNSGGYSAVINNYHMYPTRYTIYNRRTYSNWRPFNGRVYNSSTWRNTSPSNTSNSGNYWKNTSPSPGKWNNTTPNTNSWNKTSSSYSKPTSSWKSTSSGSTWKSSNSGSSWKSSGSSSWGSSRYSGSSRGWRKN